MSSIYKLDPNFFVFISTLLNSSVNEVYAHGKYQFLQFPKKRRRYTVQNPKHL